MGTAESIIAIIILLLWSIASYLIGHIVGWVQGYTLGLSQNKKE